MKVRGRGGSRAIERAIGITVHTGWGACVVVAGSLREPQIVDNRVIELLAGPERFCYHRAAEMTAESAAAWLSQMRSKALARASSELATLMSHRIGAGAIVAREGALPDLGAALATHMRIHMAEGLFYRDIFRDACQISCRIVPPRALDANEVGRLATRPWGQDQKLAALAAGRAMSP